MAEDINIINCIICLDDIEPLKCIILKCCSRAGIGDCKKVCYQCISLLYIENKKKIALNTEYKVKCPHCNQIASLEFIDNMKYIYMQIFTDDERGQLETLYKNIHESHQNMEIEEQRIQYERAIFEIETYKNYVKLCKENSKKERIEKQRQEAKFRHLQELCKKDKYDDTFIDNLIIKDYMSKKEILKVCEQAQTIKKQNPKIFNKKSNKLLCDYYDDFYYNDDYNDYNDY